LSFSASLNLAETYDPQSCSLIAVEHEAMHVVYFICDFLGFCINVIVFFQLILSLISHSLATYWHIYVGKWHATTD